MPEILLVRHGETDWNRDRRVQGHTDTPLNEAGLRQARALAAELVHETFVAVYASDLARARDTAAAVAHGRGLEVLIDRDLREKNFGTWEGLTPEQIEERFPEAARGSWGDGETSAALAERAVASLMRIGLAHPIGTVVIVSHGGPLQAILRSLSVSRGPLGNCEVVRISRQELEPE